MFPSETQGAPHSERILTPAQKLAAAERLHLAARELKAASLRALHPDWSEREIAAAVREIFLGGRP